MTITLAQLDELIGTLPPDNPDNRPLTWNELEEVRMGLSREDFTREYLNEYPVDTSEIFEEGGTALNLNEAIQALEEVKTEQYPNGILLALDVDEHGYCELESNCPLAIKLRTMIAETGITILDLLDAHARIHTDNPEEIPLDFPAVNAQATIEIAGKNISVDLSDIMGSQIKYQYERKLKQIDKVKHEVKQVGNGLYHSYLSEINRLRNDRTLPQFKANVKELIQHKASITSSGSDYLFLFGVKYHPEYLVNNSIRYRLSPDDIKAIARDAYLRIKVSPQGRVLDVMLLNNIGDKLEHYHGSASRDCWGQVDLNLHDGKNFSLNQIARIKTLSMNSVQTINTNSLMQRNPPGMPQIDQLMQRATEMGREGVLDPDRPRTEGEGWEQPREANEPRRWGQRR